MSILNKILFYKFSKRHLAKTFTWRFIATSDTIILSFFISGNFLGGLKIGFFEVFTKMVLYYVHERLWFKSSIRLAKYRHIYKTFTWRIIGTIDTIILSSIILGDITVGFQIGIAETITKMFLYYLHEKIWFRINFGLNKRNSIISKFLIKSKIRKIK
tara:strand:+ start:59 stop:532 length:474 start_codon:yes stop_codon:yes gene_type:complete